MSLEALRLFLGWAVVMTWIGSLVLAALDRTYRPEPTVHLAMMLVAGALFGPSLVGHRRGNGSRNGKGSEDA